jgi:hypothetical protein
VVVRCWWLICHSLLELQLLDLCLLALHLWLLNCQ